jgi:hypothetical protein
MPSIMTLSRSPSLWVAALFIIVAGIAHSTAASELTASDVEYLKKIAPSQALVFFVT